MSTQDNTPEEADRSPSAAGVNAYKINRGGLAAPAPAADRAEPPPTPTAPAAAPARGSRRRLIPLGIAVAIAIILGVVHTSNRSEAPLPAQGENRQATRGEGVAPASSGLPAYRALVIGINAYNPDGGQGWHPLKSARADAEAVARVLADDYGFEVRTLLDDGASRANILSALDSLATSGNDGADLIYFAGHGYFDEKLNEGYWIPADARRRIAGREAKEDWLWNSTITRLISASRARHVLVMSDACYGGALFRGDEPLRPQGGRSWYERAIARPSRYLITSGGIEPVLDSGAGHSVFAQQVINYLSHNDRAVFSANDLGAALREQVAELTGQMVQMGPLPVSGHSGGEFVFIRKNAETRFAAASPIAAAAGEAATRGTDAADAAGARIETARTAAELLHAGAPLAAGALAGDLLRENAQDPVARAVADAIARAQRREDRDDLQALIARLEARGKPENAPPSARPRVLACLGPALPIAGGPAAEGSALLYRIVLRAELEAQAGLKVIEREALATLLQEQQLGVSDLADPRARLAIGKLLPASVLLLGDLIPSARGDALYVRLVDTETTQVIASFNAEREASADLHVFCAALAGQIAERITALKPLLTPVSERNGDRLRAAIGAYHGVRPGMSFTVLVRAPAGVKTPDDVAEREVGAATVGAVAEFSCELDAAWGAEDPPDPQNLWLRERPR